MDFFKNIQDVMDGGIFQNPQPPREGMSISELIENMNNNARFIGKEEAHD